MQIQKIQELQQTLKEMQRKGIDDGTFNDEQALDTSGLIQTPLYQLWEDPSTPTPKQPHTANSTKSQRAKTPGTKKGPSINTMVSGGGGRVVKGSTRMFEEASR